MPCSWIAKAKSHYLGVARGHAGLTRKGSCHRDGGHRRRGGGGKWSHCPAFPDVLHTVFEYNITSTSEVAAAVCW